MYDTKRIELLFIMASRIIIHQELHLSGVTSVTDEAAPALAGRLCAGTLKRLYPQWTRVRDEGLRALVSVSPPHFVAVCRHHAAASRADGLRC